MRIQNIFIKKSLVVSTVLVSPVHLSYTWRCRLYAFSRLVTVRRWARLMDGLEIESAVSVAEIVTLAVQRILKESLPATPVLASKGVQVELLVLRVSALEHVDLGLIIVVH